MRKACQQLLDFCRHGRDFMVLGLDLVIYGPRCVGHNLQSDIKDTCKQALGIEPATAQVAMLPQNYVKLEGKEASAMVKLMDALDDHDDVKQVWSNFDIEEREIEASLA